MKAKKFLISGVLFIIAFFVLYLSIFYYQLGMPIRTEWWVKNCYQYKDYHADEIKGKKIIILSGSNALFGTNGEVLEKELIYPVANLAGHVYLDIDFLYFKLKEHMKEGDIVIMPLEFEHYPRTAELSNWFTKNMMAWGSSYLAQLTLPQLVHFVINTDPGTVIRTAIQKLVYGGRNNKLMSQRSVVSQVQHIVKAGKVGWRGYLPASLDRDGSFEVDRPVEYYKNKEYITKDMMPSAHFVETYKKIAAYVKKMHGKLFLTYPNMIRSSAFDLKQKEIRQRVSRLKHALHKEGIEIVCNPALFQMDRVFYFNNPYHPNKYGALIYSHNLAECIHRHLDDPNAKEISYEEAFRKTEKLEQKYVKKVKKRKGM